MKVEWHPDVVDDLLEAKLAPRVRRAGAFVTGYIRASIAENKGSVQPFVASRPGEFPFDWDGTLRASVRLEEGSDPLEAIISSDAVDQHVNIGHHFSADVEFGSWWNGWAWNFQTGKIVKVAEPHWVEARPFMRHGLAECRRAVFQIIAKGEL